MAILHNDLRFFGLDLSESGHAVRTAWLDLWKSPMLAWLQPQLSVRLVLPNGSAIRYSGLNKCADQSVKRLSASKFVAVQLPDDSLLRRHVKLPQMGRNETLAALHLEAQSQSPFPLHQQMWVFAQLLDASTTRQHFELVLTSKQLVQAHIQRVSSFLGGAAEIVQSPEVWVVVSDGSQVVLPGFGETRRQIRQRNEFRVNVALLLVSLVLGAATAATPMLQLRQRAIDADAQHRALLKQVTPLLHQRESYVNTQEQLQLLNDITGSSISTIKILDQLTRALPLDTSVLSFQVQSPDLQSKTPKVQISGQTSNAAALMQHMGQQEGVRDVKAPSPATKPPGAAKESFSINFVVSADAQGRAR